MTIHREQQITVSQRVTITGDTEIERNAEEDRMRELDIGYQRKYFDLGKRWEMIFIRTWVAADTGRGDKVALDGRWELKE